MCTCCFQTPSFSYTQGTKQNQIKQNYKHNWKTKTYHSFDIPFSLTLILNPQISRLTQLQSRITPFYLCRGHAIVLPDNPKLVIRLSYVSVLLQSLCLYFFSSWHMLGHSQTCEVQPIAREDCPFHWCAAQSTLECTEELGTENAFESTGSKSPGDENIPYFSDTGTERILHNACYLQSHFHW